MTDIAISRSDKVTTSQSRNKYNITSAARVGQKYLRDEVELSQTKWFDYRFMTPAEATDIFIEEYKQLFKIKWRRFLDIHESKHQKGLFTPPNALMRKAKDDTKSMREYTSLWIARQRADALGLPYHVFIDEAIEAHMDNGYRTIPRPNQLAAGPTAAKVVKRILARRRDWTDNSFCYSKLPQYMNANFRNTHAQIAHRAWVGAQLREGRPFGVGMVCFVYQVLPEEQAAISYGDERVAQGRDEVVGQTPAPCTPIDDDNLLPSCFALPLAFDENHRICSVCHVNARCNEADRITRNHFLAKCGHVDPRAAKAREQDRARQRRRREKLKAAAGSGSP